jgi:GMP synthase (glutamine-hydrolysing)
MASRQWGQRGLTRRKVVQLIVCSLVVFLPLAVACERLDPAPLPTATHEPTPFPTSARTKTPTPQPTPAPTDTPTPTPEPTATPRGHLEAAVILHGPSRFLQVDQVLEQNDVSSVPIQAYAGEPIPDLAGYDAVILSGGEYSPSQFDGIAFLQSERERVMQAIDQGVPILGVCLGHQLLAHWLGGRVERCPRFEVGWLEVTIDQDGLNDPLLKGINRQFYVFLWHGDQITQLPPGAVNLASSDLCPIQVFRYRDLPVWGVQFNPQYNAVLAEHVLLGASWLADIGVDSEAMASRGYQVDDGSQDRIFSNFFTFVRSR